MTLYRVLVTLYRALALSTLALSFIALAVLLPPAAKPPVEAQPEAPPAQVQVLPPGQPQALTQPRSVVRISDEPLTTTLTDDDLFLLSQKTDSGYVTRSVKRPALFGNKVYFLSQMPGVYGDASLSDPTVGHDDSAAVQAAINAAPAGSVFVVNGKFKLSEIALRAGDT